MTAFIEPARLLELSEAFDMFDDEGEGSIPLPHVPRLLKSLGVTVPDAALANLLYRFAQSSVDAATVAPDQSKKRVAKIPNDDFGSVLSATDVRAGPLVERDEHGVAHPKLSGNIKLDKISITLHELLQLFGSGGVSEEGRARAEAGSRSAALQNALLLYDVNKNGTVTVDDLRKALRTSVGTKDAMSDGDIDRIIEVADPDRTGVVDYEDLVDQLFV